MTQPVEPHSELMREINETVAELGYTAEYELQLLDILRHGWSRGPQTIPLNSSHWSLDLKRCHRELWYVYHAHYRLRCAPKAAALAPKALHSVRKLIEALSRADTELTELLRGSEHILSEINDWLSAMERMQPPRKRGGQMDGSRIPPLALILLFDYYFAATGDRPTRYQDHPFVAFAATILEAPAATIFRHLKRLNLVDTSYPSDPPPRVRGPIGLKALAQRVSNPL